VSEGIQTREMDENLRGAYVEVAKAFTALHESGVSPAQFDAALRLVAAERERCAMVVEADDFDCRRDDPAHWSETVAAKIRSGE